MGDAKSLQGWREMLSRLDRHGARGQLSPDVAGLPELMKTYRVPGISIAVGQEGGRLWAEGYGVTGAGASTPVGPRTVFQACSISKHVAAFGALRLVSDGVLQLDVDINEQLTSWRLPASEGWQASVTPRQLLAHTAGLSYNWFRGYGEGEAVPSMLQTLEGEPPANTPPVRAALLPGTRFRYSGSHYAVLQQLMTDVTGTRFDELMRVLVLDPVGMADSSYHQGFPQRRLGLVARGHHTDGTPVHGGWRRIPETAGAGLWTTATDLVRLELELASAAAGQSRLLGRDLAAEMLTPQAPGGFGLGTAVRASAGRRRFGHDGANVGYNCFAYAWPEAGAAVAVMANMDNAREVLGSILAAAEHRYAPSAEPAAFLAPRDVIGRYLLRNDFPIEVAAIGGRLTLAAPGQPPAALIPLGGHGRYRHPGLDCEITFRRENDQLYTMEIKQEDSAETATRSP